MTARLTASAANLALYSRAAQKSSARVIHEYSTTFEIASRFLGRRIRPQVESIYALVRIADEIVDGAATDAGLDLDAQRMLLDALERETETALRTGYSTNLIVHAFASTARTVGIGPELTGPFFASMRRDLDPAEFTTDEVRTYIHGSAEVVGLMCLKVFLDGVPCAGDQRDRLEEGARRLGAAFQKINFVRDLRVDWNGLGRNYFPGVDPEHLSQAQKLVMLGDIEADLDAAAAVIPELPRNCRVAVEAAHCLFRELMRRIRATPASQLLQARIRVPNAVKLRIVIEARTRSRLRRAP